MGKIVVGTSGYSYKDWRGVFYPKDLSPRDYLSYYGKEFSTVELNFSFYKQPEASQLEKMLEKTDKDFLYSVKAHQSLTHQRKSDWQEEGKRFTEGLSPLLERRQLTAVLFQFPYSFHYTRDNRLYLARLFDFFNSLPLAVEFRNREWQQDSVREELRKREISTVLTDSPALKGLPQDSPGEKTMDRSLTGKMAYLRFHGRNKENWWEGDNLSRYDYLYSEEELNPWVTFLIEAALKTALILVYFNNHYKGQAVRNGLTLKQLCLDAVKSTDSIERNSNILEIL